ncbi:MAG: class I SAM-dependent methyltransferase [Oscillospiraceae bacterium]|jgi:ubiquinone/menaquinone biosynthesis C-methylase UbiE|nr:class I SAM-dependent methyltransferase [Oscillospiraceae bacterium]
MGVNYRNTQTGWERDKRTLFDEIVDNYDRERPDYPRELFDDLIEYLGAGENKKALEIGAGTGKSTTPLLDAGYNVTAVEPGENMAEFLRNKFKGNSNFNVIVSDFEKFSLEEENYNLVYAATAFHWVEPQIGCPKVFRILKSGGVFALFRYNAVPSIGETLYEAVQEIYEKHYYNHYTSNKRPVKKSHDDFCTPAEILHSFGFADMKEYGFCNLKMKLYDVSRTFTADEFVAIRDTFPDHRGLPESNRTALYAGLKEVILKHGGQYDEKYTFQLYMGRKL